MIGISSDMSLLDTQTQTAISAWLEHQDEAAAEWLVRQHRPMVTAIVKSRFKDSCLVEDIVQLVFIKCFRSFQRVREGRVLAPWLARIAINTCANVWRGQSRAIVLSATDAGLEDLDMFQAADESPAIQQQQESRSLAASLLLQLAKQERRLLWWHYFKSCSASESGRRLGISAGNVRVRLCRAQKRLAEQGRVLRDLGPLRKHSRN